MERSHIQSTFLSGKDKGPYMIALSPSSPKQKNNMYTDQKWDDLSILTLTLEL